MATRGAAGWRRGEQRRVGQGRVIHHQVVARPAAARRDAYERPIHSPAMLMRPVVPALPGGASQGSQFHPSKPAEKLPAGTGRRCAAGINPRRLQGGFLVLRSRPLSELPSFFSAVDESHGVGRCVLLVHRGEARGNGRIVRRSQRGGSHARCPDHADQHNKIHERESVQGFGFGFVGSARRSTTATT